MLVPAAAVSVATVLLLPAGATAREPSRVQVVEKEYSLVLSRLRLPPGASTVEVLNFGTDAHDLVIQRNVKGAAPIRFPRLLPRERATRTIRLALGRYTLWCSLPGHRQRGMIAPLVVR